MSSPLSEGTVLASRYRLESLVGEGGMGVVWAARHTVTGKRVALKVLKSSSDRAGSSARLLREARAACSVRHPNVVAVHDVVESLDGSPVLVMDLLEGETLRARLVRESVLSVGQACDLLLPAVSAVGTAHASGVVHRDLKPENIFLARAPAGLDDVRVLDFGIAKLTAQGPEAAPPAASLTATGAVLGTVFYMAPEQVYGERDVDHRVDIWALGVILYECLAGRRPTDGANVGQVMKIITSSGVVPIREVAPGVPSDIADLVMRMLSRSVSARPADLREVADVLARHGSVTPVPFGAPGVSGAERGTKEDSEIAPSPSPDGSSTVTFDGVDGSLRTERLRALSTHTSISLRRPRVTVRGASVVLATLAVAALVALALIRRSSPAPTPPTSESAAASIAEPPSSPLQRPIPPDAPARTSAELTPSNLASTASSPPAAPRAKRTIHAKDAGTSPVAPPAAAGAPHSSPGGIVETPPF